MPVTLRLKSANDSFIDQDGTWGLLRLFGLDWHSGEVAALLERPQGWNRLVGRARDWVLSPVAAQRLLALLAEREAVYRGAVCSLSLFPGDPRSHNEVLITLHARRLELRRMLEAAVASGTPIEVSW